jgi:very-short-patch-repair endonuclease
MTRKSPLFHDYNRSLIESARDNRKEMTPAKRRMWYDILKNLPFKFMRQRVIGNYIVDFYCASKHLIIEVDGNSHFTTEAQTYDKERTLFFESLGIHVVRFTNDEVLGNVEGVFFNLDNLLKTL